MDGMMVSYIHTHTHINIKYNHKDALYNNIMLRFDVFNDTFLMIVPCRHGVITMITIH